MRLIAFAAVIASSFGATRSAIADSKPSMAILEIVPRDHGLVAAADAMTAAIRAKARAKTSGYTVKGTPKEVDDAMLASECNAIQPRCAVGLGETLAADYAIAGELERRGTHQILLLSLVDVHAKKRIRAVREITVTKGDAKKLARAAYVRLIDGEAGSLSIVANAQSGDILIDGQSVAALFEGRASIDGLVNGGHQLSIRAAGFRPFDVDITIQYATKETVLLDPE